MTTKKKEAILLSSGISGLDSILHGGFPARRTFLLKGDPGSGKTSLALQFLSHGALHGESTIYFSFSESLLELQDVADSHGWPLDKIEVFELASEISKRSSAGSSIFHSAETELPDLISKIIALVERVKPTRIGIDSLTELRNMADSDRSYRRALFRLKVALEELEVTTLFIDSRSRENRPESESLVHGVIDLHMETPIYGPVQRSLTVTKLRGRSYETGFHDFTILTGGLHVYPRIRPREIHRNIGGGEPVLSGVEALDQLLGGGLDRGTNSLILGASGTGKSMILLHYTLAAAARGEKAVIYTFDEDVATFVRRAENMELPLSQYLHSGHIRIEAINAAELSPGHFAHLVREDITEREVSFLSIDSLNGYLYAMPGENALIPHLHDLLVYLGAQGVVAILTMTLSGLFTSETNRVADLSYLADTIVLLRYLDQGNQISKSITAVKQRTRDHQKSVRELSFGPGGIHISPAFSGSTAPTKEPSSASATDQPSSKSGSEK